MGGIASCNEVSTISAETKKGISDYDFEVTYSRHVLDRFILMDFLQNDIPYFTVQADVVCYGLQHHEQVVGRKSHG